MKKSGKTRYIEKDPSPADESGHPSALDCTSAMTATSDSHPFPTDLLRCVVCDHDGLARSAPRVYCPQCGQVYLLDPAPILNMMPLTSVPANWARTVARHPLAVWSYEALSSTPFPTTDPALTGLSLADPILETGPGYGSWIRPQLASSDVTLIRLDYQQEILTDAQTKSESAYLIRAHTDQLPIASASMGTVILGEAINKIDWHACLREASRVLKPGGSLIGLYFQWSPQVQGWLGSWLEPLGLTAVDDPAVAAELKRSHLHLEQRFQQGLVTVLQATRLPEDPLST